LNEAALADGASAAARLRAAADAAQAAAQATIPLRARKGRASYLGERSEGHEDPGSASAALLLRALAETAAGIRDGRRGRGPARMTNVKLVGVVLVSHSRKLAEGLAELVRELGGDQVPIIAAGGMDDGSLGTSYGRIEEAVQEADQGAGVLLLGDLGSSLLTIKTLLGEGRGPWTASAGGDLEGAAAEEACSPTPPLRRRPDSRSRPW
jgi:hypothetical protein